MSPPAQQVAAAYRHLHADATRALSDWRAPDAPQEQLRRGYLAHLAAYPDAVAKAGPPAHLTASVLVFDEPIQHVLLTLHRKVGAWLQFGGHLEPTDTSLYAAAEREAREESGLPLNPGGGLVVHPVIAQLDRHSLGAGFTHCREHLDVRYVGVADHRATPVVSAESHDVRWWPLTDLPDQTVAELAALIAAARRVVQS